MWKYLELSFSKSERPYCYLLTIGLFYIHEFMHYNKWQFIYLRRNIVLCTTVYIVNNYTCKRSGEWYKISANLLYISLSLSFSTRSGTMNVAGNLTIERKIGMMLFSGRAENNSE